MQQVLVFLLVIVAIALIALVLIQHGKGADVGAAFGSGASNTVFGSQGSTSFLFKLTFGLAVVFFILLLVLTRMSASKALNNDGFNLPSSQQTQSASNVPVVPAAPASAPTAPAKA